MSAHELTSSFKIWGLDGLIYGPVELPTLVEWVKDERVNAETWIFHEQTDSWKKATHVRELQMFFQVDQPAHHATTGSSPEPSIKPGMLRRVKILADMTDQQLMDFVKYMEVYPVRQWNDIVKQGEDGDAMYLVLEGELRVRIMISGKESILATLHAGDFFGEVALFDRGPRSADVVANKDSVLLKISSASFQKLVAEAPPLATPILFAVGKTLAARIRADNKRFKDSVAFARSAGR
jgi:CRP/FNR family transcriptional regulator, cyclic AMP receptor protein